MQAVTSAFFDEMAAMLIGEVYVLQRPVFVSGDFITYIDDGTHTNTVRFLHAAATTEIVRLCSACYRLYPFSKSKNWM